ncbi:acyl-CoA dehydrogenase family protein [Piscinibacter sakaiensis]|uniref:Butyryl-CoA dehydrogenase n=1 Tax=Piscinibacter sakaiensis TaxID=1547922 RepID=A0A0K8P4Q2_PISS1|nr:acyl-CoA dehydrogenase family protein [Piscinibacter sakaiensis]GAP37140.1 butyryl-CoA dehydrogenase [Piscinibacter sakaiensis]
MSWGFETDAAFQKELDWIDAFVREEVEPLDLLLDSPYDVGDPVRNRLVKPLQQRVRDRGLWACHLEPELGGQGYGQVKLALMNEILGRSSFAPTVFGCQAPDSGNAEILAKYGTPEQKRKYLQPLLGNDIVSCFAMTEPQGGSDPTTFRTRAVRDGDDWVISGQKWFASNANYAAFYITLAVTDPDVSAYKGMSMFIVPADAPGIRILRDVHVVGRNPRGHGHGYLAFDQVRVPADHMLGRPGEAFVVAQTRLGGGRIHHAMRTIGEARKAFDMLCERAVSRSAQRGRLADKQLVQAMVADSWIELEQFRLLVLRTAWLIDKEGDYKKVRKDISAVKAAMPKVLHDIVSRAIQIHGSLGITNEMPFVDQLVSSLIMGLADGPTEVHKITLARELLSEVAPSAELFPDYHLPRARERARAKYGAALQAADGL